MNYKPIYLIFKDTNKFNFITISEISENIFQIFHSFRKNQNHTCHYFFTNCLPALKVLFSITQFVSHIYIYPILLKDNEVRNICHKTAPMNANKMEWDILIKYAMYV